MRMAVRGSRLRHASYNNTLFYVCFGSQHSRNGVSAELQPAICTDGGVHYHCFVKGTARSMQRKLRAKFFAGMLC